MFILNQRVYQEIDTNRLVLGLFMPAVLWDVQGSFLNIDCWQDRLLDTDGDVLEVAVMFMNVY